MNAGNFLGVIIALVLLFCLGPWIAMWGWSLFAVPVFGMKALTFWQAFGLCLLLALAKSNK